MSKRRWEDFEVLDRPGAAEPVLIAATARRLLRASYEATRVLDESQSLAQALPLILRRVCETLGWDYGEYHILNADSGELSFAETWHDGTPEMVEFHAASRTFQFGVGDGSLPARVAGGEGPFVFLPDLASALGFRRAGIAARSGLRAGVAFPAGTSHGCHGVLAFFGRRIAEPGPAIQEMMLALGTQVGHFVKRLHAEDELLAQKRRFVAFMDNSPLVAFAKDAAGRYIYTNRPLERRFGAEPGGWIGKTDAEVWPAAAAEQYRSHDLEVLAAGEAVQFEESTPDESGLGTWLSYKFPFSHGDQIALGGISLEITERREAESQIRLRDRAIDSFQQGVCITDASRPDNPIVYVNRAFQAMTGYSEGEVIGTNCRFLQGPKTSPAAVDEIRRAVRAGEACLVELLNYRKDGSAFWNALSISPIHDASGRLTHFAAAQTDVTPFKMLEEQLRQSQKMDAIGRLAGGVAHDFNNLLTVINGYADILLEDPSAGESEREMLSEIRKAGSRASSLTRQLLAFSRKAVIETRELDLNAIVLDMEPMLRRIIGEDVALQVSLPPSVEPIRGDAGQIEQILLNLVVNARDAMPKGGRLTIATADRARKESLACDYVSVTVTDTGCGMSSETQARIFEPFFTTKPVGQGTGLGLATVYGIVQQSGGRIEVESEEGRGSTFRIDLPVAAKAPSVEIAWADRRPSDGSETVLVAEDEGAVRTIVRLTLQGRGYRVLEAADGGEALRVATTHDGPIHLLLTDVVMPEIDGQELSERIRAICPDLKVVFLSGYTDDEVIRRGVLRAEAHFMQKPFTPAALAEKVRAVLDLR